MPARLEQACFLRPGHGPQPASVEVGADRLSLLPADKVSGSVQVPWPTTGFGEVPVRSTTLMQRREPYRLALELARGELNRLRNQLGRWEIEGLRVPETVTSRLRKANTHLCRAIRTTQTEESDRHAGECLCQTLWAAEEATAAHARFALDRHAHARTGRLGCRLDPHAGNLPCSDRFRQVFGHTTIPVHWRSLEPKHGERDWSRLDRQIDWCVDQGLPFAVGPIFDLHAHSRPDWLARWLDDPETLVTLLTDLVESCVARYQGRVSCWETTSGTNSEFLGPFGEEQMVWLSGRMLEAAHHVDPGATLVLSLDRPWGDYLADGDHLRMPVDCVDALLRTETPLSAVNLDIAMGYSPGGCFCRTLLNFSQLLDEFAEVGVPVWVRLVFPSGEVQPRDVGEVSTDAGIWRRPMSPETQAEWAEQFVTVAFSKPFVDVVTWGRYQDGASSEWPLAGVLAADGAEKPAMERLLQLRTRAGIS